MDTANRKHFLVNTEKSPFSRFKNERISSGIYRDPSQQQPEIRAVERIPTRTYSPQKANTDRSMHTGIFKLLNDSVDEIYFFDSSTFGLKFINSAAIFNLGYRLDEIQSMALVDIMPLGNREQFSTLLGQLLNGEADRLIFKTHLTRKNNTRYDVDMFLYTADQIDPGCVVARVHNRLKTRKALQAVHHKHNLEALSEILRDITRDIDSQMMLINGYHELLREKIDGKATAIYFLEAEEASNKAMNLARRMKACIPIGSLAPENANINHHILDNLVLLRQRLGSGTRLDTILSPELWDIHVDTSRLQNALIQLVMNEHDATRGNVNIILETSNASFKSHEQLPKELSLGDYTVLTVTNNLCEKAINNNEDVFESSVVSNLDYPELDIGLSMADRFARQSGGRVVATGNAGGGITFTLYLPRSKHPQKKLIN